ncbi:MAG TPA: hypothetical protein VFV79_04510 [Saprospiraceae bacterium]|nr:hypothetical protein [Saprospiraceae bacterium]
MQTTLIRKPRTSLFIFIGLLGFLVVLLGFGKTLPGTIHNPLTPLIIYVHATLAFSWISLFFIQSWLIRYNNFRLHRTLGYMGIGIGIMTGISMLPVGLYETKSEISEGLGDIAFANFTGTLTSAIIFLSLVIAGMYSRNKKDIHKRLMLLATIFVLWPAWFRLRHYFPSNPDTEAWFVMIAFIPIVIAWLWEKNTNGKIHPTLLYVGLFLILEATVEQFIMYGGNTWVVLGKNGYALLTM